MAPRGRVTLVSLGATALALSPVPAQVNLPPEACVEYAVTRPIAHCPLYADVDLSASCFFG